MGIAVMIMGESGSGKTASLRNCKSQELKIFNVANKPLPFKRKLDVINNIKYKDITNELEKQERKLYVIDDSQYLMAFHMFDKAMEKGYDKFSEIAQWFYSLIKFVINKLPEDTIVYFLHHTEVNDMGKTKAKTIGKMLDNQLTLEGLFSIVLMAKINDDNKHVFVTQSDGCSTCKSPMDMFPALEIDNDLKAVDSAIREYYEFDKFEIEL